MEAWRKTALCFALALLIVASSEVPSAQGQSEDCWIPDEIHYIFCIHTRKCRCRETCQHHGYVDGRCNGAFPYLGPLCECLLPNCH
ncbi:hypothetical protein GUJ93_ZPchr0001g32608 [Zizania palustris]|uniref:Knottin scorpion toxin-like domain-containing protein n=1 Tax=Zizania palustris TaxID=103762 RepID=A0A8J5SCL4_ZIZPA|nr:hypothetical protein GUJ93_ZPchr0001g32608 [Zizania palustris]